MVQWGTTDDAANSVGWAAETIQAGSGKANIAANNTALYNNTTPSAFISKLEIGQFAVTKAEIANGQGEVPKTHGPGWTLRRNGMGPVIGGTVAGGTGFANGETVVLSGGTVNATLSLTTNATGNLVSSSVVAGGLFPNASVIVKTYQRQQHLESISVTGATSGFNNTDYIVASNGTSNGRATLVTNATGGITNSDITLTNVGLWGNTVANAEVVITCFAANGAASNGTGETFSANLVTSTANGTLTPTLGGRAGRVTYETLVVVKGITGGNTSPLLPS